MLRGSALNSKVWLLFYLFVGMWNLSEICWLLAVGTLLGALTGALIGQETESGFVRGAAVGAISGAVFSLEVFESSLLLWQSDESGIRCLLYLVSNIDSFLTDNAESLFCDFVTSMSGIIIDGQVMS